jgi:hypothetical protein
VDPGLGVKRSEDVYEHQRINSGEEYHPHHVIFFQQVAWQLLVAEYFQFILACIHY